MNFKNLLRIALAVAIVALVVATPAFAQTRTVASSPQVPEIDPGSFVAAAAIVSGGLLMLTDRFARRRKQSA